MRLILFMCLGIHVGAIVWCLLLFQHFRAWWLGWLTGILGLLALYPALLLITASSPNTSAVFSHPLTAFAGLAISLIALLSVVALGRMLTARSLAVQRPQQSAAPFAHAFQVSPDAIGIPENGNRYAAALRESEERYRQLVELSPDAIIVHQDNTIVFVNSAGVTLLGATSPQQLIGQPMLDFVHPAYRDRAIARIQSVREGGRTALIEGQFVQIDGQVIDIEIAGAPIRYLDAPAIQVVMRDITERKRAEALQTGQCRVLEMMATGASLPAILTTLIEVIEAQTPDMLGSILLLDAYGQHLRHGAAPRLPDAYVHAIDGMAIGPHAGSCGTAAYRHEAVMVTDIAHDPLWDDFRELALGHALRACWSTPIFARRGAVVGTFAMYYGEPRTPTAHDQHLIARSTHLAGIAIEQARAAEALRASEARFRDLIEGSIQGIVIHRDLKPLFANQQYAEILDYQTPEEILQLDSILSLLAPHERERITRYVQARRAGQSAPPQQEHQVIWKDGTPIWLDVRVREVVWYGEPAIQATIFDITERKQAEQALRESEARYRALVEHALAGIYIIQDDRYCYVNPKLADILGYTPEEMTTQLRQSHDLVAEEDRPRVQANLRKQLRGEGGCLQYTFRGRRKDGALIDVEVHGTAMAYQGRPAVIGTLLDLTERKRAEALVRCTERLASLGTLAAGIAHEIKNPIGMMVLAADTVRTYQGRPGFETQLEHCLQTIIQQSERCDRIVSSILQFARQETLDIWPEDFNTTVRRAVELTRPYAMSHSVHLNLTLDDTLPAVAMNPIAMEQVIVNLLRNAIEAQAHTVWVQTAATATMVQCCVRDDGCGLTDEQRQHLFDPFYTTRRHTGGTGLGMSIAYGMLIQHGGTIDVQSQPGVGTTITIALASTAPAGEEAIHEQCASY